MKSQTSFSLSEMTSPIILTPSDIHIWIWEMNKHTNFSKEDLNEYELKRFEKLEGNIQLNYLHTHGMLKFILSKYFPDSSRALRDIKMQASTHGKPELIEDLTDLQFNLTHSGDYAAVAINWKDPIGVDLEHIKKKYPLDIPARFFTKCEYEQIQWVSPSRHADFFYSIWSKKEAISKAAGLGIANGEWQSFTVFANKAYDIVRYQKQPWQLHSATVLKNHWLSVACGGEKKQVHFYNVIRGKKQLW